MFCFVRAPGRVAFRCALSAGLSTVAWAFSVSAQDASTTSPPPTLPPVVVQAAPASTTAAPSKKNAKAKTLSARPDSPAPSSATGVVLNQTGQASVISPTSVSTPASEVASSVTVVTSNEIQRDQLRTVPDALRTVPGLNIVQSGGPGGQTSVFLRGTNSNQVKVLIDGIDVSDPSNNNRSFDFGQLLTADIERIEVLRGPQSGLYGSEAIGGVISIVTKKGEGPPKAYASLEGGSFGTFNQATGVSGSTPGFNYAFNIAHFRSGETPVTPLNLLPPGRKRNDDSYENATYSTKLGTDISKDLTINFVARYTESELKFTGGAVPAAFQSTQDDEQFYTRGEAVWSLFGGRYKNYFGLAYTDAITDNISPRGTIATNEGDRVKYDWRGVAEIASGQILVTGLERQDESLTADPTSATTGNSAAFVELQSRFTDRFSIASNFRYDDNDTFGGKDTYRVAPTVFFPETGTRFRASYGTGFKAPSLSQLYVSFPDFGFFANPNLKPETSSGYDAGFEQPLFGDRVRFGATYFHNSIENLIDSNDSFTSYTNVGQATTYGVESFASFAVTDELKVRGDYTYTIATNDITDRELLRRPKNKATLTAAWQATDKLTLSSTLYGVGSWADGDRVTFSRINAPGYATVNVAANYAIDEHIALFGRINNLLDKDYQDPTGFLRPGLGVFGGIRIEN